MIYYTEEICGDYLIPTIKAFFCDVCGKAFTDQKTMSEFKEFVSTDGTVKDLCPRCQQSPLPKNFS